MSDSKRVARSDVPKVDISRSRRSRSFPDDERLWANDLDRLVDMIEEHVENLKKYNREHEGFQEGPDCPDLYSAPNLSLAVFGPAGTGKSSFLKTLVAETRTNERLRNVSSLDILQPARFGEGDHLLYATVAAGLNAHRANHAQNLDYEVLTKVLKAYRDLAGDLRVLREEPPISDLEPQALAAEVIQRHSSGLNLGTKINEFLQHLADDLNQNGGAARDIKNSVVLLPVDDLDLSPQHLRQSLRELQAYLLNPRLIPVFCFTDRLAEEILAGEFAKLVGHADEGRRRAGRLSVSEQLAVQYLSKCFPIRNRIRLGPIPATLQGGNLQRRGRGGVKEEPVLWTLITASVLLFGVPDRNARHPVRTALRPSTLRRQFHVIDAMRQVEVDSLIKPRVIELLKPGIGSMGESRAHYTQRPPSEPWGVMFDRAAWALLNVHRDVLREFGMHLEDLYSWAPHGLRRILLDSLFQKPGNVQTGLWQRWRSLADSRRSQIISLLASNAYRPWLEGERPSGEDLPQIAIARAGRGQDSAKWCRCKEVCQKNKDTMESRRRCKDRAQDLPAPVALQWFLDLAVAFYLPLGRSVFRHLKFDKTAPKEPLSGAGWSFHSGPINAAQAAHDDQKLFPAGMMFLDTFSYASSLTTAPRVAACRVLDEALVTDEEWPLVKQAKVFFLSARTSSVINLLGTEEDISGSDSDAEANDASVPWSKLLEDADKLNARGLSATFKKALFEFEEVASWESGESSADAFESESPLHRSLSKLEKGRDAKKKAAARKLLQSLVKHDYPTALSGVDHLGEEPGVAKGFREHIKGLEASANAVHDDQLLLRIWTCYGYNRGRFWGAVSLWRGLGLMGQLIEAHRRWQVEYLARQGESISPIGVKERQRLLDDSSYREWIAVRIEGVLHTHSLRGLVPGKDLGEPTHRGTLELAFSGWNTEGQRKAIRRLSRRLQSWLDYSWGLKVSPSQKGQTPQWGSCFIRRLQGEYFVGSLWQWLDAEFLEHQGKQYGQRRSYYWNAGVALTSWLRVLQRYFGRTHEVRWLLETCPISSPFLSRTATDPFLSRLSEKPYVEMLKSVARDGEDIAKNWPDEENSAQKSRMRAGFRFRAITQRLQKLWINGADLRTVKNLCGSAGQHEKDLAAALDTLQKEIDSPPDQTKGFSRRHWIALVDRILKNLAGKNAAETWSQIFADEATAEMTKGDFERIWDVADLARRAVRGSADDGFDKRHRESLLASFDPRHRRSPEKALDADDEAHDLIDSTSACFEIASMIQQHWKVTAHASAASLFYQVPRVRRLDFFDHDSINSVEQVALTGKIEVESASQAIAPDGKENCPQSPLEKSENPKRTDK